MIDRDGIINLLSVAAAYDARKPNESMVIAWGEASRRAHWDIDAAVEALHEHYANDTTFAMPGHVTAIVRHHRSLPERYSADDHALTAGDRPGPGGWNPSGPPAGTEHVRGVLARLAEQLGWNRKINNQKDQT